MKILAYPGFRSSEELTDFYYRCCWYLPDLQSATVFFPCFGENKEIIAKPKVFGKVNDPQFISEIISFQDNHELLKLISQCDFILIWNDSMNKMEAHNLDAFSKKQLRVDNSSESSRHEAYHFAILRHELMSNEDKQSLLELNRSKLKQALPELKTDKAYVFGTGPSLEECNELNFSDGMTIVCNAIVKNKSLLGHLQPKIITATDPALHLGISQYASDFRDDLKTAMETYNAWLFTDLYYYPLFVKQYPELEDRVIGVPHLPPKLENISLELDKNFHIACYANVLTLFLLPLASTFADKIYICGCDGKKTSTIEPDNPSPFWAHHKASEFENVYDTLKVCHPSFFMLNYKEWYEGHCRNIKYLIDKGEALGKTYITHTTSYIPVLVDRLQGKHKSTIRTEISKIQKAQKEPEYSIFDDGRTLITYKVSIIISIYNADRFIIPLINNIINQTLYRQNKTEIIIIDSNSPGNEYRLIKPYLEKNPHIIYARTIDREPLYKAWNRAVPFCRGEYVMNMDVDNRIRSNAIELFANYLDQNENIGVVYGNQYVCYHENQNFEDFVSYGYLKRPEYTPSMMLHKFYFGSELMWRRDLYDKVGLYDESYIVAGDYEMACRMATVTNFGHLDVFFGLYLKNLNGIEYSNLELCNSEDKRIRELYKEKFPKPIDPPRIHIHYPMSAQNPGDYITIICQTNGFHEDVRPYLEKISFDLQYPHQIFSLDFCSSPETKQSLQDMISEGLISDGNSLVENFKRCFDDKVTYSPQIRFYVVAFGKGLQFNKDLLQLNRLDLTSKILQLHNNLLSDFKDESGQFNLLKIPNLININEANRLDLKFHKQLIDKDRATFDKKYDFTIIIQHFCPKGQENTFGGALKRNIQKIRQQEGDFKICIIVTDDGSEYTKGLAPQDINPYGIQINNKNRLREAGYDIDADLYLYKNRTEFFSKGLLWNQARKLAPSENIIFMDDDQLFMNNDSLKLFHKHLKNNLLVIGNTIQYNFYNHEDNSHQKLDLGYDSRVVQGSNFAVTKRLLENIGGFSDRSFWWGKGDDPEIMWKLYLHLKPLKENDSFKAVYVDAIRTQNLLTGRWQTNCKVSNELFVKDFIRLYGVHPFENDSRIRKKWVEHIKDEAHPDTQNTISNSQVSLRVILDTRTASEEELLQAVSFFQNSISGREIYLCVISTTKSTFSSKNITFVKGLSEALQLFHSETDYSLFLHHTTLLGDEALTMLNLTMAYQSPELVMGNGLKKNGTNLEVFNLPDELNLGSIGQFLSLWTKEIPFIGKNTSIDIKSDNLLEILLGLINKNNTVKINKNFYILNVDNHKGLKKSEIAFYLSKMFTHEDMLEFLCSKADSISSSKKSTQEFSTSQLSNKAKIYNKFDELVYAKIKKLALFGGGQHSRKLLQNYLPYRGLEVVCIFDDFSHGGHILNIPILSPSEPQAPKYDAVLISSDSIEEKLYNQALAKNLLPVYRIYESSEIFPASWKDLHKQLNRDNICNLVIYGGGKHTKKLLQMTELRKDFNITGIIDDFSEETEVAGIPVLNRESLKTLHHDALVISSDSLEDKLYKLAVNATEKPIYKIYSK